MKNPLKPLSIIVAGCFVSCMGCQATPPANQGHTGYRMDPTHESGAELGTQKLTSADLVNSTDQMAQDIATDLDVTNRASPPRIVVGDIENRTAMPSQNYQIFLERLRAMLMSSGARHGLEFIADAAWVEQQRAREYGEAARGSYESRADYVLTCQVWDMPSGGTRYYLLDYQLVQLRDAESGPDLGAGAIVWESKYEVKFQ